MFYQHLTICYYLLYQELLVKIIFLRCRSSLICSKSGTIKKDPRGFFLISKNRKFFKNKKSVAKQVSGKKVVGKESEIK